MFINKRRCYQGGMTLIELMIGMTVGLIVVGMVTGIYISALGTSSDTLKASRLNQEMSAILNIMVNDIRRAGYANVDGVDWDGGGVNDFQNLLEPSTNPFNLVNTADNTLTTALRGHQYTGGAWVDKTEVDADPTTNVSQCHDPASGEGACGCIVYGYDKSNNGLPGDNEFVGFRYNADDSSISMRTAHDLSGGAAPNTCGGTGWYRMNDQDSIKVTKLIFDLSGSTCVNTDEPDGNDADTVAEIDCYTTVPANDSGAHTVERRDVLITLEAQLVDDSSVKAQMQQRVSVRNDLVRVR